MPAQEAELLKNDCSPNQQKRLKDSIARALNDVGADAEDYVRYFYQGNCLPRGKND
jgi:hypothetical protein